MDIGLHGEGDAGTGQGVPSAPLGSLQSSVTERESQFTTEEQQPEQGAGSMSKKTATPHLSKSADEGEGTSASADCGVEKDQMVTQVGEKRNKQMYMSHDVSTLLYLGVWWKLQMYYRPQEMHT